MQSEKAVAQSNRCSRSQQVRAVTHALASFGRERPSAVVTAFLVYDFNSDIMRYVGGGVLNNPVTRASQSRGGGRIPRAGRLKQVWVSAMRRHGSEGQASSTERTVGLYHGKAVLCSNNHQRSIMNTEQPPKVQICANRFELISRWGQPVDKAWARDMFDRWLDQRMDSTEASDYDSGVQTKGDAHVQPD